MNINKYIYAICAILFVTQMSFSEEYYIKIESENLLPLNKEIKNQEERTFKTNSDSFNKILSKCNVVEFYQAFPTAKSAWLQDVYFIKGDITLLENINANFQKKISYIEEIGKAEITYTPNDYGLSYSQTYLDLIRAKEAWDIIGNLPRIPLAIIDTYFDTTHEDLDGIFITVHGSNSYLNSNSHGTSVVGLMASITNNNLGISSIGHNSQVYASRLMNSSEILRIAQLGYKVINCSWYTSCNYSVIEDSLFYEIKNTWNTVVVFGAGNNTSHCGSLEAKLYPSSYSSVLSVTSVGHMYEIGSEHETWGKNNWKDCHDELIGSKTATHHHNDAVDICAPGYHVGSTTTYSNGNYEGTWGTSFAAPQVSATLGLIFSINPCLSADEGMTILLNTADNSIYSIQENQDYIGLLGSGRLDVYEATVAAANSATIEFQLPTNFSNQQVIESNYAIKSNAHLKITTGSDILFKTRMYVELHDIEVEENADFEINVDKNNIISCSN